MDSLTGAIVLPCLTGVIAGDVVSIGRGEGLLRNLVIGVRGPFVGGQASSPPTAISPSRTMFWRTSPQQRPVRSLSYCWHG